MNSIQLIKIGEKHLKNIFNINPEIESELILSNILNTTREKLIINPEKNLNKSIQKKFNSDIKKRKLKKPIAYILGYKEFWNKKFKDNIERDIINQEELKSFGWKSKIIWECETKNIDKLREKLIHIIY